VESTVDDASEARGYGSVVEWTADVALVEECNDFRARLESCDLGQIKNGLPTGISRCDHYLVADSNNFSSPSGTWYNTLPLCKSGIGLLHNGQ